MPEYRSVAEQVMAAIELLETAIEDLRRAQREPAASVPPELRVRVEWAREQLDEIAHDWIWPDR